MMVPRVGLDVPQRKDCLNNLDYNSVCEFVCIFVYTIILCVCVHIHTVCTTIIRINLPDKLEVSLMGILPCTKPAF